jgi:hypothetical protein
MVLIIHSPFDKQRRSVYHTNAMTAVCKGSSTQLALQQYITLLLVTSGVHVATDV